ncbi:hypothetical protein GCM10022246_14100 [Pedobacter ginsengiterrae]|uniref:Uncharacterized protein n=1 Tax=Pedobacter ginsengiterrae TaxID=871696 RepID=A0ABP7PC55_9SPHI|nr:hypothetical protein [Pedobacter aquatilis]
MVKKDTTKIKNELIISGLQTAGKAIGLHTSKSKTKKTIEKNLSLVNSLMRAGFSHKNDATSRVKKNIELAGMGAIAFYNFYKGIKQKRRAYIIQGAFLSTALIMVILTSNKIKKNTPQLSSTNAG